MNDEIWIFVIIVLTAIVGYMWCVIYDKNKKIHRLEDSVETYRRVEKQRGVVEFIFLEHILRDLGMWEHQIEHYPDEMRAQVERGVSSKMELIYDLKLKIKEMKAAYVAAEQLFETVRDAKMAKVDNEWRDKNEKA